MSVSWFRLHHDFRRDPKLRSFSKAERSDLIDLLLIASESNERGTILLDDEDVAAELELNIDDYNKFVEKLIRKKILHPEEDGALMFINWDIRQVDTSKAPKPSDAPEETARRQRERRARLREQKELESRLPVTQVTPDCHAPSRVTVTPREEKTREDIDKNKEEENSPAAASVAQSAGGPVAEAGIEHALDEQRRKIPPTLEEVRQWFQEWRGRPEVGEKYWEWFNGRGWPRNVDWKGVAYRKAADWCSREDGYIQEEAIKTKSTPAAKKQDIETMTVKCRIDPNDLPPPGWKLGDPIKRSDEEMQAMRDALAPAREKIGRSIPA